jgi:hypothetical protein
MSVGVKCTITRGRCTGPGEQWTYIVKLEDIRNNLRIELEVNELVMDTSFPLTEERDNGA